MLKRRRDWIAGFDRQRCKVIIKYWDYFLVIVDSTFIFGEYVRWMFSVSRCTLSLLRVICLVLIGKYLLAMLKNHAVKWSVAVLGLLSERSKDWMILSVAFMNSIFILEMSRNCLVVVQSGILRLKLAVVARWSDIGRSNRKDLVAHFWLYQIWSIRLIGLLWVGSIYMLGGECWVWMNDYFTSWSFLRLNWLFSLGRCSCHRVRYKCYSLW